MHQITDTLLEIIKYTGIQIPSSRPLDILEFLNELKDRDIISIQEVASITERINS